jgi:hypothetical protein
VTWIGERRNMCTAQALQLKSVGYLFFLQVYVSEDYVLNVTWASEDKKF